jgi:osmoprotectant transport system substrate-binding protein
VARTLAGAAGAGLAAILLAACGASSISNAGAPGGSGSSTLASGIEGSGVTLSLGTKDFTEEFVLGQLYKQALEANGCKVDYDENIGPTEIIDRALTSGQIDAYPEYTGESVATVAKIDKAATSAQEEYNLARAFYARRGQVMSQMTRFADTDAIAVRKSYAQRYGLVTIADLNKLSHFTLGGRPEFLNRQEGAAGVRRAYGIGNFTFKSVVLGVQYQALDSGAVDAIDVFTTDPQLASGKYTLLKDPKNVFGFQNVALVISKSKLSACPNVLTTVDAVNRLLTTPVIIAMNKAVAIDKRPPAAVATAFLKAHNLP